jgi:hypothetical protein
MFLKKCLLCIVFQRAMQYMKYLNLSSEITQIEIEFELLDSFINQDIVSLHMLHPLKACNCVS